MSVKKQVKTKAVKTSAPQSGLRVPVCAAVKKISGRDFLMMGVGAVIVAIVGLIPLGMQTAANHKILSKQMFVLQQIVLQQHRPVAMPLPPVHPIPQKPKARRAQFDEGQYRPYGEPGPFEISGDFCKHLPPHLMCSEKAYVFANPVTDYSQEWFERHWRGGQAIANPDQRAWHYHRKAVIGPHTYTLTHLPAGEYYIGAQFCAKDKNAPATDNQCTPVRLGGRVHLQGQNAVFDLPLVHQDKKGPAGCGCQHKP